MSDAWRQRVVDIARAWVGTPFLPGNCVRGRGCDCGTLLAGIFADAGLLPALALGRYDYRAPSVRGDNFYLDLVRAHMEEIPERSALPADIVLYRVGRAFSHGALIVSWPRCVIHAERAPIGVTASGGASGWLKGRDRAFFRLREVPC